MTFVANVSAKSSGEPVSHSADWKALMEGTDGPHTGEAGGDGGLGAGVPDGDGNGWAYRFLAIPALFTRRSM